MKFFVCAVLGVSFLFGACAKTESHPQTDVPPVPQAAPKAPPAAAPEELEKQADTLFLKWNMALQTQNSKKVAALYTENALLIPTASNDIRFGRDEVEDYFDYFLTMNPDGRIVERHVQALGPKRILDNGVYVFSLSRGDVPEEVTARYTFLYEKIDGRWYILNHHSSAMPNPVAADPNSEAS